MSNVEEMVLSRRPQTNQGQTALYTSFADSNARNDLLNIQIPYTWCSKIGAETQHHFEHREWHVYLRCAQFPKDHLVKASTKCTHTQSTQLHRRPTRATCGPLPWPQRVTDSHCYRRWCWRTEPRCCRNACGSPICWGSNYRRRRPPPNICNGHACPARPALPELLQCWSGGGDCERHGPAYVLDHACRNTNLGGAKAITLERARPITCLKHILDRRVDRRKKHAHSNGTARRLNAAPLVRLAQATFVKHERMRIQRLQEPRGCSSNDDRPQSAPRTCPENLAVQMHLVRVEENERLKFLQERRERGSQPSDDLSKERDIYPRALPSQKPNIGRTCAAKRCILSLRHCGFVRDDHLR